MTKTILTNIHHFPTTQMIKKKSKGDQSNMISIEWTNAGPPRSKVVQLCPKCKRPGTVYESRTDINKNGFHKAYFDHYIGYIHYIDNTTGKIIKIVPKRIHCFAGRAKGLDTYMKDEIERREQQAQLIKERS